MSKIEHTISSGNVFGDLGYEDSIEMSMKSDLVRVLADIISASGKTQNEVANILGIDQPKISRTLRGQFRGLSLDKIMSYILALGSDINMTISKKKDGNSTGHFHMAAA